MLGLTGSAAACFSVNFDDGVIACGEAGCPSGFACGEDGFCYRDAADGDQDPDDPVDDPPPLCTGSFPNDFCSALPLLPLLPEIDGVLDCGATLRSMPADNWLGGSLSSAPSDHSAEVAVAWRPDGLYVYAQVHEPELDPARNNDAVFDGDAFEVYLDDDGVFANPPQYDPVGTRQLVAAAPERSEVSRRGDIFADMQWVASWSSDSFVAVPTATGFAVEAFIPTSQLGTPDRRFGAGERIGLNLAINVSRDSARDQGNDDYLGQYFLHVASSGNPWPFANVDAFCTPTLVAQ